jgi:hypothetical protein
MTTLARAVARGHRLFVQAQPAGAGARGSSPSPANLASWWVSTPPATIRAMPSQVGAASKTRAAIPTGVR